MPAAPGPALRKGKCKATTPSFPKLGPLPWGVWALKGQECVGAAALVAPPSKLVRGRPVVVQKPRLLAGWAEVILSMVVKKVFQNTQILCRHR